MAKCFDVTDGIDCGRLDLNDLLIPHPASTFFMKVEGDSVQDAGIFSGDILVVDRSRHAKTGDVVVASVHGELTVALLKSIPPKDKHAFEVWGVVTASVRRF